MQDFGLSFAMCVHGSLCKERFKDNRVPRLTFGEACPEGLGAVRFFSIPQNSSSQLRRGLTT